MTLTFTKKEIEELIIQRAEELFGKDASGFFKFEAKVWMGMENEMQYDVEIVPIPF